MIFAVIGAGFLDMICAFFLHLTFFDLVLPFFFGLIFYLNSFKDLYDLFLSYPFAYFTLFLLLPFFFSGHLIIAGGDYYLLSSISGLL